MGDPVGAARHAREHLAPGGTVMLVEPFAIDPPAEHRREPDGGPVLRGLVLRLHAQLAVAGGRAALGAQAGEARLREVFEEAGFRTSAAPPQTPMNLIIEAKA